MRKSSLLTVVCFKWFDPAGRYNDRFVYSATHVNRLKRMVQRHLSLPHEFACITDNPAGLDPDVRAVPIDYGLVSGAGHRFPKLMIFRPDAGEWLGERILMLDLDTVVVAALDPLLARNADFVAWQEPKWGRDVGVGKYNSSMLMLKAGSHPEVWEEFQRTKTAPLAHSDRTGHSDQALLSKVLGDAHPVWTSADGVLSFKRDIVRKRLLTRRRDPTIRTRLPANARIVFFHGGVDPAQPGFQAIHKWVGQNWA